MDVKETPMVVSWCLYVTYVYDVMGPWNEWGSRGKSLKPMSRGYKVREDWSTGITLISQITFK